MHPNSLITLLPLLLLLTIHNCKKTEKGETMGRMDENIREAERALTEKPMYAVSIERVEILERLKSKFTELPQPLRFARVLTELLSEVSVPLKPYDLIAGRQVDRALTDEEEALFQRFDKADDNPYQTFIFGSGHGAYSWEKLTAYGLPGFIRLAEEGVMETEAALFEKKDGAVKETLLLQEKADFFRALAEVYRAIQAFMLRYAAAADNAGMQTLSVRLRDAAMTVPGHFDTALQLLWIVCFIDCSYLTLNPTLTLGRMDQFLYPLYEKDLKEGYMTREEMGDLITDYYCKHNLNMGRGEHQNGDDENSTGFGRILNFDAPQYLILGGKDSESRPAVNDLSLLFAERIVPSFKNPVVVTRYFTDMNTISPAFYDVLIEKAFGSASLMFYNEDSAYPVYEKIGIPEEDARNMDLFGCNWPALGDLSMWMNMIPPLDKVPAFEEIKGETELGVPFQRALTPFSWPETITDILKKFAEADNAPTSIDDFYEELRKNVEIYIGRARKRREKEIFYRAMRPSALLNFTDCFFFDAVRTGTSAGVCCKYHMDLAPFQMFGTVTDSLTVIDALCFRDRKLTLKELYDALQHNFEGTPEILAYCRNVPKYGSDDAFSDYHTERLADMVSDIIISDNAAHLRDRGLYLAPSLECDTWHFKYGRGYGATPDGRLAGMSFSQNAAPSPGSAVNGLSAMFNALLHAGQGRFLSGALNLDVDPRVYTGEYGRKMFAALLAVYFNRGGLHAQISSVSVDELLDAQLHPERHRDLRVRVTGYSGVFVDICKDLQDDIIRRMA